LFCWILHFSKKQISDLENHQGRHHPLQILHQKRDLSSKDFSGLWYMIKIKI